MCPKRERPLPLSYNPVLGNPTSSLKYIPKNHRFEQSGLCLLWSLKQAGVSFPFAFLLGTAIQGRQDAGPLGRLDRAARMLPLSAHSTLASTSAEAAHIPPRCLCIFRATAGRGADGPPLETGQQQRATPDTKPPRKARDCHRLPTACPPTVPAFPLQPPDPDRFLPDISRMLRAKHHLVVLGPTTSNQDGRGRSSWITWTEEQKARLVRPQENISLKQVPSHSRLLPEKTRVGKEESMGWKTGFQHVVSESPASGQKGMQFGGTLEPSEWVQSHRRGTSTKQAK